MFWKRFMRAKTQRFPTTRCGLPSSSTSSACPETKFVAGSPAPASSMAATEVRCAKRSSAPRKLIHSPVACANAQVPCMRNATIGLRVPIGKPRVIAPEDFARAVAGAAVAYDHRDGATVCSNTLSRQRCTSVAARLKTAMMTDTAGTQPTRRSSPIPPTPHRGDDLRPFAKCRRPQRGPARR